MKLNASLVLAMVMLVATACAPSAQPTNVTVPATKASASTPGSSPIKTASSSSPESTSTPTPTLMPSPSAGAKLGPVDVKVKPNDQLSASAVISTTGGTLTAKGADGTQFTLTVPKDALLEETKITLTPIAAMEGSPFSGAPVGAVQMSPEGLRFFQPVTLTIESPNVIAAKGFETVGFGYHQSGEGLYLNPAQVKGNTLVLTLLHFSGTGAAQGTSSEIQNQYEHVPANAEDALTQRMAEYLGQERQRQLLGQPPDPALQAKTIAFQREYFTKVILPKLAVIRQDCEASKSLLPQALGWLRTVQLWGWEDQFRSESQQIYAAWDDGVVNCYNKEYDQCMIDKDIKHRAAMLNLLRLAEMGRSTVLARLDPSKAWKCPRRSYHVDGTYWLAYHLTGTICDLDKPFELAADGGDVTLISGSFTLNPTAERRGDWTFSGSMKGVGPVTAVGTFQLEGVDTGAPVLVMGSGHWTVDAPFVGPTPIGPGGEHLGITEKIELEPATEVCK